jgi:hypothetical protein
MKSKRTITVVFALMLLILSYGFTKAETKSEIEVTIQKGILEKVEDRRPQEVFVYEIQRGDPARWIKKLEELVGIKGRIQENKDKHFIKKGDRYLEVRKSSTAAFYGDMSRLWREEPSPGKSQFKVPGDEEARKMILEWLGKFGFADADLKSLDISISDEIFEITVPAKKETPMRVVIGKNVEVRRRISNLSVFGPGSKIKFYIGGNGEVNGFMAVWRQVLPNSSVLGHKPVEGKPRGKMTKPISSQEAFRALKKNPLDHLPLALVYKIEIDTVDFGYYSRSAAEYQKYLQPVYVFSGTAFAKLPDGKNINVPYRQYVVALRKPLESIWPETRYIKPKPRVKGRIPVQEEDKDEKGGQ